MYHKPPMKRGHNQTGSQQSQQTGILSVSVPTERGTLRMRKTHRITAYTNKSFLANINSKRRNEKIRYLYFIGFVRKFHKKR